MLPFSGNLYEIVVLNDGDNSRLYAELRKLLFYPQKDLDRPLVFQ